MNKIQCDAVNEFSHTCFERDLLDDIPKLDAAILEAFPDDDPIEIKCELACVNLVTQTDDGTEGYYFDNYLREVGLFGFKGAYDDFDETLPHKIPLMKREWPDLNYRVIYKIPTIQAYVMRLAAREVGLDVDVLQLYHAKREREIAIENEAYFASKKD